MLLALQGGFANTWDSFPQNSLAGTNGSLIPSTAVGVETHLPGTSNVQMSNFGTSIVTGVTTVGLIAAGISSALPVIVNADYSCWCPVLGKFVAPENTNLLTKLME